MMLGVWVQWVAFILFALLTVLGALGMTTTMSMFRSGIFLMASFIGVAGLFVLLSADLIGLLQIMMYIGGMLVMILFMLLFSMDPGGAVMAGMEMSPIEKLFSRGLKPTEDEGEQGGDEGQDMAGMKYGQESGESKEEKSQSHEEHDMQHGEMAHDHDHHGMRQSAQEKKEQGDGSDGDQAMDHGEMPGMDHAQHGQMDHGDMDMGGMDMSMVTPARTWAAYLGTAVVALLVGLLLWRPAWPVYSGTFSTNSPLEIGTLLMGKYMMAFEGAGLLILLGIFGAVMLQRPASHPSAQGREAYVTSEENPVGISEDD